MAKVSTHIPRDLCISASGIMICSMENVRKLGLTVISIVDVFTKEKSMDLELLLG